MTDLVCTPYGVGHVDEGVCLRLEIGPYQILLDCGLQDIAALKSAPPPDCVICSHAHPDHAQGLLDLHRAFPTLPIYSSDITAQLLPLNWLDQDISPFAVGLSWHTPLEIAVGLSIEFWPAGHLPGAACVLITYTANERCDRIFYTGDYYLSNTRLVDGVPLSTLRGLAPDVLIVEGGAGTRRYPPRRQQENTLAGKLHAFITEATQLNSVVAIPAPILGSGQELLMLLRSHYYFTGLPITVWVDPIIAAGCDGYLDLLSTFPRTVQNFASHQPIFWDDRIFPRVKRLQWEDDTPIDAPAIVLVHPASEPELLCCRHRGQWAIFLPEGVDLARWQRQVNQAVTSYDWLDRFKNATTTGTVQLETYTLTTHCDQSGTLQLIHNIRPRHVVLIRGSVADLSDLANLETLQSRYQIHIPTVPDPLTLILDANFWQPASSDDVLYEGEVSEVDGQIILTLPTTIAQDLRWAKFAETGLINIRWQGENLVLGGIPPDEILSGKAANPQVNTCSVCSYQKNSFCQCPNSPLFKRQVAPDGYCLEFLAQEM